MARLINHLLQLQELTEARNEQAALSPQRDLTGLDEAINELMKELPNRVSHLYQRLSKRDLHVVVPIQNQACGGCGGTVPPNVAQRAADDGYLIQQCDICGRILYSTVGLPQYLKQREIVPGKPTHGLLRFSAQELMLPKLEAETRDDAIAELAQLMEAQGYVENGQALHETALRREAISSTAVGHGLAFPHARTSEGGILTFSLGLKKKGIDFSAPDGVKVKAVFLLVIPSAASSFYLRLLSGFVQAFSVTKTRNDLLGCKTSDEMWQLLLAKMPPSL